MKRFFSNLLIIIYAVIAIFVTVCLLSFNENRVTVFGDYSLIIIDNSEIQGDFQKGSLAIVCRDPLPKVGEKAFFYNVFSRNEIVLSNVTGIEEYPNAEATFKFGDEVLVSESSIIGSTSTAKVIPYLGTVLKILESKWGYLFLVVLISLLMFLYELTKAIEEIKDNKSEARKDLKEKYEASKASTEEKAEPKVEPEVTKPQEPIEVAKEVDEKVKEEKTLVSEESNKSADVINNEEKKSDEIDETKEEKVVEEIKEEVKETIEPATEKVEEVIKGTEENKEVIEEAKVELNAEEKSLLDKIDEIEDEESLFEEEKKKTEEDKKEE